MSQRAELLAAVKACPPLSVAWNAAVWALGAGSKAGFPAPRRPTGATYYQTIWGITRSHHFTEAERAHYREAAQWEHGSEVLYREVTGLAASRAAAERRAKQTERQLAATLAA